MKAAFLQQFYPRHQDNLKKNLLLLNDKVRTGDTKDQVVMRKLIRMNLTWKIGK